jgi:hypothetical protein
LLVVADLIMMLRLTEKTRQESNFMAGNSNWYFIDSCTAGPMASLRGDVAISKFGATWINRGRM